MFFHQYHPLLKQPGCPVLFLQDRDGVIRRTLVSARYVEGGFAGMELPACIFCGDPDIRPGEIPGVPQQFLDQVQRHGLDGMGAEIFAAAVDGAAAPVPSLLPVNLVIEQGEDTP